MDGFSDSDFSAKLQEMERTGQHAGIVERQKRVLAWFYRHPVRDDVASQREGRTIYHDTDYVFCKCKGDTDGMSSPVTPAHIEQFPQEWALFVAWKAAPESGIRCLPGVARTPSILRYCEDAGFRTIEQLAAADKVQPELEEAQAVAKAWVSLSLIENPVMQAIAPKKRGGRKPGSRNKPKVPHAQDTEAVA
jgi:hypothetical protein